MSGPRSVVLMYHRVGGVAVDLEEGDYALPFPLFEEQMRWLAGSGRPVVPLAALLEGERPDGSVVLTFDDGFDTDARVAAPLLRELGLAAAFFVSPALVDGTGYLSWEQVRALADQGFTVGSHGLDHSILGDLDEAEQRRQLVESKRRLEERLGRVVDAISLPGGRGERGVLRAAREAGYRLVLGSRPAFVGRAAPQAPIPRFPIRRGHGLGGFRALAEQRALFALGQGLRHRATRLARAVVGAATYGRVRMLWVRRSSPSGWGPRP